MSNNLKKRLITSVILLVVLFISVFTNKLIFGLSLLILGSSFALNSIIFLENWLEICIHLLQNSILNFLFLCGHHLLYVFYI